MLELKDIVKDYLAGENTVHALRGINLQFRSHEFVSILGPSGCGKTTLLNIVGGLDQYTSGDLMINGRSTKEFKDRDWDTYRNHSIGFVFQSYNLIPHQTVLQNVELALTLTGVSKAERRERAKKALEDVGLGNQLSKRPSEMSGGQMQRVAIARALVNNPDIILADEPTGALDTETSVQVMEILKKVAQDRLIIMVTHNPDLAEQYSTRIIRMLDGVLQSDSNPLTDDEYKKEKAAGDEKTEKEGKQKKPSMSFATSFGLSLKNLFTKKGRTVLTAFAGSIGIIGIALILSISEGVNAYINQVQEETLSSYPLTLESSVTDMTSVMQMFMGSGSAEYEHEMDAVYTRSSVYKMLNAMNSLETSENDLNAFKKYVEEQMADENSNLHDTISGIHYSYDLNLMVYTKNVDGKIIRSDASDIFAEMVGEFWGMDMDTLSGVSQSSAFSMLAGNRSSSSSSMTWQEMLDGTDGELINDVLYNQYDVVYGAWPSSYDEVVLVINEKNELDDMTLYALGLISKDRIDDIMHAAMKGEQIEASTQSWSYEELCGMEFHVILNSDCYVYDPVNDTYSDLRSTDAGVQYLYDNGMKLKISGIIRPNPDATATMLNGSVAYTTALTEYVVNEVENSDVIKAQRENPDRDILSGLPFKKEGELSDNDKKDAFTAWVESLSESEYADLYVQLMSIPDETQVTAMVEQTLGGMTYQDMQNTMIQALSTQMGMNEADIAAYLSTMTEGDLTELFRQMLTEQMVQQMAEQIAAQFAGMSQEELVAAFKYTMESFSTEDYVKYYEEVSDEMYSNSNYDDNLVKLGYIDLATPTSISLYAATFEDKDVIKDEIDLYNDGKEDIDKITYTDYVGLMMSSITTIINVITYVLIAFVAISLIVSSIMIGVITLISVQERTKEIGILRAIGASKKDVSSMFNAETLIIGFASGTLGVLVTYVLCLPINAIIHHLSGIYSINAFLPPLAAVILVLISMFLTLISGIIPSRSAAKKDPVVALRTE